VKEKEEPLGNKHASGTSKEPGIDAGPLHRRSLDSLKARHAEAVQPRIEVCDAAAADQYGKASTRMVASAGFDSNSSDREPCKVLLASALHNTPPDRVWKAFITSHDEELLRFFCRIL